jgi:enoyl-CoA hydratase
MIGVERKNGYAVVRLQRPSALNALSATLLTELSTALEDLDRNPECHCIVLSGSERAFAAGADIKEMAAAEPLSPAWRERIAPWDRIKRLSVPLIAAVSGYALGGGCELAMLCDIIVASDTARFGQPEINLGIMPGAGATQRLTHAVGKYRAMELVLTGSHITAQEAHDAGLVNRVVSAEQLLPEAERLAALIASKPPLAVRLAKEAVLQAAEMPLEAGLAFERRNLYLLFGTADQKEGMNAFLEKRQPHFEGR